MNLQMANAGTNQEMMFGATSAHMSALKDFIKMSIQDESFFTKSRSEQKDLAMDMIQKHKKLI